MTWTKHASWWGDVGKELTSPQAAVAVLPVAAAAAGAGVQHVATRIKDVRDQSRAYSEMMKLHPHLKKQDEKKVKRYFGTLARFNPRMAKDPTVAGAWLTNVTNTEAELGPEAAGQALLGEVKDLAQVRNHLATAHKNERGSSWAGEAERRMNAAIGAYKDRSKEDFELRIRNLRNQRNMLEQEIDENWRGDDASLDHFFKNVEAKSWDRALNPKPPRPKD